MILRFFTKQYGLVLLGLIGLGCGAREASSSSILNVSYDPTRELYDEINRAFGERWRVEHDETISIQQSHGGSGKQARAVIDGLQADVVTLALAHDIDMIAKSSGLLPQDWQSRLPNRSTPFTSIIVFVVRSGNPKGIAGWDDLVREGVSVVTPNPKTSGGARWNYLAAWGYALRRSGGREDVAESFVAQLYRNVPVLDTGARGSTTSFVEREIGDVLIAWENEAKLIVGGVGKDRFAVIYPSLSILAEPPVALLDGNVDRHGTRPLAQAYLDFLYLDEAQTIAAGHGFRPSTPAILAAHAERFPPLELLTLAELGDSWDALQRRHFEDGGTFDAIYRQNESKP